MHASFYEQMLTHDQRNPEDAEAAWDARSKHFNTAQQKDSSVFPEKATAFLKEKKIISGAKVLDIGGGSGRYAVPFAAHADYVTLTDISANMLTLAENNAQQAGHTNIEYVKLNWTGINLSDAGWQKHFDLVFASMCPAIRSAEGLYNMISASKGYCLINQFIASSDSLSDYLIKTLGIQKKYNPHNDRNTVQAVFNLLWMKGYEPEISYLRQNRDVFYTTEEAAEHYGQRYTRAAQQKGMDIKTLVSRFSEQESFTVNKKATLAMILWKV